METPQIPGQWARDVQDLRKALVRLGGLLDLAEQVEADWVRRFAVYAMVNEAIGLRVMALEVAQAGDQPELAVLRRKVKKITAAAQADSAWTMDGTS